MSARGEAAAAAVLLSEELLGVIADFMGLDFFSGCALAFGAAGSVARHKRVSWRLCRLESSFGSHGPGDGQFCAPSSIVATASGVAVSDAGNCRVQSLTPSGSHLLSMPLCPGPHVVAGLAAAADGTIFAGIKEFDSGWDYPSLDRWHSYVLRASPTGDILERFGGACGGGSNQFSRVCGVSLAGSQLLVVDQGNHRIVVLGTAPKLRWLRAFGSQGSGRGELSLPETAIGHEGSVYVADQGNARVSVWTEEGRYVRCFGAPGGGAGMFEEVCGLAILGTPARLVACDVSRLHVMTLHGVPLHVIHFGAAADVCGVTVAHGQLFVTDQRQSIVHVLHLWL